MAEIQNQQPQPPPSPQPVSVPERIITLNSSPSPSPSKSNENKLFVILIVTGIIFLIAIIIFALAFMSSSTPKSKQFIDYQYQFIFSNTSGWDVTDPEGDNFFALQTNDKNNSKLSYVGITAYPKPDRKDFPAFFKSQNTTTCANISKTISSQTKSSDYQNGDLSGQICSGTFLNTLTNTKMSLSIYNLASSKTKYVYSVATRHPFGNALEQKKVETLIRGFRTYTE